jgi:C4-dicarboxylate transporter DctM subunit
MSVELGITLAFVIFFGLLAFGVHIHTTLLVTGLVGLVLIGRGNIIAGFVGFQSFPAVASYSLTTIPLFVLTAQFILQAGVVEDIFTIIYNVSRGRKGYLGTATMVAGAFLGAVSGSGSATAASLGQAAYPQLVKHGYRKDLAAAVAAAAGSLSSIIPPSVVIIVYGVITETSISTLFIAAIVPGILLTLVYILCTLLYLRKDKKAAGVTEEPFKKIPIDRKQEIIVLVFSTAVAITIFGGIYSGFVTPTEAGALGAVVSLIGAALLKKVNKAFLIKAGKETLKVTSMVMLLIIGAKIFGRFMSFSLIARKFIALLNPLLSSPGLVIAIIIALYFVLFMLLEGTAVMLMTTPLLLPLMDAMGMNHVWFGILVCLTCVIGLLTPPVGMCVYAVCGAARIPVEGPFKVGIMFAIAGSIIVGGLMILVPEIATFLPNLMR